jgi:hypothetical protein
MTTGGEFVKIHGGLQLTNTTIAASGMLRWSGSDFEGYNGSAWQSLTASTAGGGGSGNYVAKSGDTMTGILRTNGNANTDFENSIYNASTGGFAWSATTTDTIASSTASGVKVVDDELMTLRFAAQAAVTTPTGQYGVTSTYIATASY